MASRSPKTWCITHFHVVIRIPPWLGPYYCPITQFRPQKWRKPVKIKKIRYKSVITKNPLYLKSQKSIFNWLGILRSVWHLKVYKCMCSSNTTSCQNCVIGILPAKNDFTGIFQYNPLYWGQDRPDNIFSYLFLCCDFIATLPVHYFQRFTTLPCLQTSWSSVHGIKMYVTVQYVYIVMRGSDFMLIGLIHLILSRSRHATLAFYSFRSIFRYNGGFSSYTLNSC